MFRFAAAGFVFLNLSLATGLMSAYQASQTNVLPNGEGRPFTHTAFIPADSDLESIRLERVKAVEIRISAAAKDSSYCDQLAFREPGGSTFCAGGKEAAKVKAYEVSYSYVGPPSASDEHGQGTFTFQVYFRPDEVAAQLREGLALKKRNRAEVGSYFTVKTEREAQGRLEVDDARSRLCPGHYADGVWVKNDSACKDEIVYKTGAVPSGFVTVTVSPVATQVAREVGGDFPKK